VYRVLQPKIAKNSVKNPILGVQGRSRSSMFVPLESSWAVLVIISSKSVSICNRFHTRWANSGEITISKGGYPSPILPLNQPFRNEGFSAPNCVFFERKLNFQTSWNLGKGQLPPCPRRHWTLDQIVDFPNAEFIRVDIRPREFNAIGHFCSDSKLVSSPSLFFRLFPGLSD